MAQIKTTNDFITTPWKNGGGRTTELYRIAHPHDPNRFIFRLSKAFVEKDGPFSLFPEIDRTLILLEGPGILLTIDGIEKEITAKSEPFYFSGETSIECRITKGPCTDFNIMVDRKMARTKVKLHRKPNQQVTFFCESDLMSIYDVRKERLHLIAHGEECEIHSGPEDFFIEVNLYFNN